MRTINRRSLIAGAGAFGASACVSGAPPRTVEPDAARSLVLVHGAWHGGWCWRAVRAALEAEGWRVITPTLTGLGDRSHLISLDIDVETHARDIINAITWEELDRPLLVLHSYAGMPGAVAADRLRDRLAGVLYLDAVIPENGETFISQNPAHGGDADRIRHEEARTRAMAAGGPGIPPFPATLFGIPAGSEQAAWVDRRLTPHPVNTWLTPARIANGGSNGLRRLYAHCTAPVLEPSSLPYHAARVRNDPSWRYAELKTGHDAMVTAPAETAALISAFARDG